MQKKKVIIILISTITFIVIMIANVHINNQGEKNSLTFTNIEALANTEDSTPTVKCPGGSYQCAKVTDSSGAEKTFYKGN